MHRNMFHMSKNPDLETNQKILIWGYIQGSAAWPQALNIQLGSRWANSPKDNFILDITSASTDAECRLILRRRLHTLIYFICIHSDITRHFIYSPASADKSEGKKNIFDDAFPRSGLLDIWKMFLGIFHDFEFLEIQMF